MKHQTPQHANISELQERADQITQYIGRGKVQEMFDISGATVWRMVRDKRLPAPYRFSKNCVRWSLPEIVAAAKAMTKGADTPAEQPGASA